MRKRLVTAFSARQVELPARPCEDRMEIPSDDMPFLIRATHPTTAASIPPVTQRPLRQPQRTITVIKTQPMRSRTSALPVAAGRPPSGHGFGQGMAGCDLGKRGEQGGGGGGGLAGGADRGGQVPGQPGIIGRDRGQARVTGRDG
jgi:hypothetical protein